MLKPRLSMAVVLAAGTLAVSSCESGDTIVSVNYGFDDATAGDVKMNVAKIHVQISAASGGSVQTDIDIMRDPDAGTITTASYKRVKVDGLSGKATVTATALDSGGNPLGNPATNADDAPVVIVAHEVTAAFVKFAKEVTPTPDAGMEMDAAGSGGSSGSGGSTGSGGSEGTGGSSGSGGSGSGGSG
jgi:uncharacterized membrane protein YgcG